MNRKLFPINFPVHFLISLIFTVVLFFAATPAVHAQAIQMQLTIEEEFSVRDVRPFYTSELAVNQGWAEISPEHGAAGQFVLHAAENILIGISLDIPEELRRDENNTIPLQLKAAHSPDFGKNGHLIPFNGHHANITLSNSGVLLEKMDPAKHQLKTAVFLYGEVYVGNIEEGLYQGTVNVEVEYH